MATTNTQTSTGPVESQTSANERRIAEERLNRFLTSVREMDQFIKENQRHSTNVEPEPVKK